MDPSASSPTNSSKNFLVIGLGIIAVVLLIATGYLFMNTQSLSRENKTFTNQNSLLQTQVSSLKDEKVQLEKDLIYYKGTDLAKEIEVLNLKLQTREKELAETKTSLSHLQGNLSAIPKATRILSLIMGTFAKQPPDCYSDADKAKISQELSLAGDSQWQDEWNKFIRNTDSAHCGMSPEQLSITVNYGLRKISEAVK